MLTLLQVTGKNPGAARPNPLLRPADRVNAGRPLVFRTHAPSPPRPLPACVPAFLVSCAVLARCVAHLQELEESTRNLRNLLGVPESSHLEHLQSLKSNLIVAEEQRCYAAAITDAAAAERAAGGASSSAAPAATRSLKRSIPDSGGQPAAFNPAPGAAAADAPSSKRPRVSLGGGDFWAASIFAACTKIWDKLSTSPSFKAFKKPVTAHEAPTYSDVVNTPMDLQTAKTQLGSAGHVDAQTVRDETLKPKP